jgi:hypothetical protein
MIYKETIGGIPLEFDYTYQTHGGKKFPKILSIEFRGYNLTEIVDHTLKESVKSSIFKELNEVNTIS